MISGHTGVLALLGSPVEHSLSPAIHNTSFSELGLDYVYVTHEATLETIGDAIAAAKAFGYAGLNVTMPCKNAVIPFLDDLDPAAKLMGAVNTIKREGDKLVGYNTDGKGMTRSIHKAGYAIEGSKIVVIGAGGAGSAIYNQCALDKAARIDIFNLVDSFYPATESRVKEVAEATGVPIELHDLKDEATLEACVRAADIVVDATRVGMPPLDNEANVKKEWLHPGQAVADTVYHPLETHLLKIAAEAGATPVDGLGMLIGQAAAAEEIWFGVEMPVDIVTPIVIAAQG